MSNVASLIDHVAIRENRKDFYFNLPSDVKQKYLEDKNAVFLLSSLPENIRDILTECFLRGASLKNHAEGALVYDYFGRHSPIIQDLRVDPGTDSMLRRIYIGEGIPGMYSSEGIEGNIDKYFYNSLSGQALRNRFRAIVKYSSKYLGNIQFGMRNGLDLRDAQILNLGSGSAGDSTTILAQNPHLKGVNICCVDIDNEAIHFGEKFSEKFSEVIFLKKSMVRLSHVYDYSAFFGLLIGILCGLNYENCVKLLSAVKRYFKPGALLISAALTERMAEDDLLCAYILYEMAGWNLQFAPFGRLQLAYREAGYTVKDIFTDSPTDFYEIVTATI